MTGIDSWSTTAATNATADGGSVNLAENQAPSTMNNTLRQMAADIRARENDAVWFQYGTGDQGAGNLAVPGVYASATSFTITGADVTAVYHAYRRVRAVGVSTGTIYGTIASVAYNGGNTTTTVTMVWDSGSLSNETLVISLSQIPVTGKPGPASVRPVRFLGLGPIANYTIASDAITVIGSRATVDTEGAAASDDLATITGTGAQDGDLLLVQSANSARVVTLKDQSGNLQLAGDFALANASYKALLIYQAANSSWIELSRSNNG